MKIKLVFPPTITYAYGLGFESNNIPPYGMGIITSILRNNSYFVEQEDLMLKINFYKDNVFLKKRRKKIESIIIKLKDQNLYNSIYKGEIKDKEIILFIDEILNYSSFKGFNLIGFSILTFDQFLFSLLLTQRLKQRYNTPIVLGGAFINLYGDLYPEIFNFVDYMIRGDGGVPLLKLIDYLKGKIPLSEVPNLTYKKDEKIISNPQQYYPLEDMPVPDFRGLPLEEYRKMGIDLGLPYQISRGCSNRCPFCTYYVNERLEFKSFKKVVSEIKEMKERYKSNIFYFCDNAINNSYEYLDELMDSFIENKLDILWIVYAKIGKLNKEILKKMKEAGCLWLKFGIESGSKNILKMMHKGFDIKEAEDTLRYSHEVGIKNRIFLVTGYPYERSEDIINTIRFLKNNKKYIDRVTIYKFTLEKISILNNNAQVYGVKSILPRPCRYALSFDETKGLKWNKKVIQQERNTKKIMKAILFNGIGEKKNIFIIFVSWWFYTIISKNEKLRIFLIRNKFINILFIYFIPSKIKATLGYFQGCFVK